MVFQKKQEQQRKSILDQVLTSDAKTRCITILKFF